MKKIEEYVSTILTSELTDDEKIAYLRIVHQLQNLSEKQIKDLEDKIYILGNKTLSEKDRLLYEANFLHGYYKCKDLDLTEIRRLYYKINKSSSTEEDINKLKMLITQLQLENGLNIRFYKSYLDLLEKMQEEQCKKMPRTFHK